MLSRIALFVCLLAILATVVMADTITSSYAGDVWTYDVTFDATNRTYFRVYLGPKMSWDYVKDTVGHTTSAVWSDPTGLGMDYSWGGITLPYLQWQRQIGSSTSGSFWFGDAHYVIGGSQEMDLVNHPGPLVYYESSNQYAPTAETIAGLGTPTTWYGYDGIDTAITPEPTTMSLFGLGLLGLIRAVRRRRGRC